MIVYHINTHDLEGGAARAAFRLHQAYPAIGVDSLMLVQSKHGDDIKTLPQGGRSKLAKGINLLRPWLDSLPLYLYSNKESSPWSCNWLPQSPFLSQPSAMAPDILHLHWIGAGFAPPSLIAKLDIPVVWTLHDMWPFTGGCHYAGDCVAYRHRCGACPQLGSHHSFDLSRWIWKNKEKQWRHAKLTIVSPSRWLGECAASSALFRDSRIEVIPNGLDLQAFKPLDKTFCRNLLGLPLDKKLVLFGAMSATSDKKKGFALLLPALRRLAQHALAANVELIIFGASTPADAPDFAMPTRYLGRLHDDISLSALYSAADVVVTPSTQENLSNVVMESLACGTPVVAFDIGGMPDLIQHEFNGFLAKPFDTEQLASGIQWVLENRRRWQRLSENARLKAERSHAIADVAKRYLGLYQELISARGAEIN